MADAAIAIAAELFLSLNGEHYVANIAGEAETENAEYTVVVADDIPDHGSAANFIAELGNLKSAETAPIVFNVAQTKAFIGDQIIQLRVKAGKTVAELPNEALYEIVILRWLAYKAHLINDGHVVADHHVRYNNCVASRATGDAAPQAALREAAPNSNMINACTGWMNGKKPFIGELVKAFSDIVCTMAFVFRQKGHHYQNGYDETYNRIWEKLGKSHLVLHSTWAQRVTFGLHAIMPDVLDTFWRFMSQGMLISPPLQLRIDIPAAGTAAGFALEVGWRDARAVYSEILDDHVTLFDELVAQNNVCRRFRWRHGINATFYGEDPTRLKVQQFTPMAATVVGIYKAIAADASLLASPSLAREASGSPLQMAIAGMAAKALQTHFINVLQGKDAGRT